MMKHEPELASQVKQELERLFPIIEISEKIHPVVEDGKARLGIAFERSTPPNPYLMARSLGLGIWNHGTKWLEGKPNLAVYSEFSKDKFIYYAEIF